MSDEEEKKIVQIVIEFDGEKLKITRLPNNPLLCISILSLALQEIYARLSGYHKDVKEESKSLIHRVQDTRIP